MGKVKYFRILALFFIALMSVPQIAAAQDAITCTGKATYGELLYNIPFESIGECKRDGVIEEWEWECDDDDGDYEWECVNKEDRDLKGTWKWDDEYDDEKKVGDVGERTFNGTFTIDIRGGSSVEIKVEVSITVEKKDLTITAVVEGNITYGADEPEYTVTYEGFVNGETESVLAGDLKFETTYEENKTIPAGTYNITPSGYTSSNYEIKYEKGTLTVNKAPLTITAVVEKSITYGDPAPEYTVTCEGFVNDETESVLTGDLKFETTYEENKTIPAGTHDITPSGYTSSNYEIEYKEGTLIVNKAPLTITAVVEKSITYGEDEPEYTVTYEGFVNDETESVLTGDLKFETTYEENKTIPAGTYNITPSGYTSSNYEIKYEKGTLTVDEAEIINVAVNDIAEPRRDVAPGTTATIPTGSNVTFRTIAWTPTPTNNLFQGGETYTVTVTLTANTNYKFANSITPTINGKPATVVSRSPSETKISYTFPETSQLTVSGITIRTQPTNLTYTHGETLDLSGLVATLTYSDASTEDVTFGSFGSKGITTDPQNGTPLNATTHNDTRITVKYGNLAPITTNLLTVSKAKITSVAVNVAELIIGENPSATATAIPTSSNFTPGQVTWSPSGTIKASQSYTASIPLTAKDGYEFADNAKDNATINGEAAANAIISSNNRAIMTISRTFQSPAASVTAIEISKQPAKLTYSHGDALDLTGIQAKLTYNDETTKTVDLADFATNSITTNPDNEDALNASTHNGKPITVIYNNSPTIRATTNPITVNKAKIITAEIIVTIPVADEPPSPEVTTETDANFTGTVAWSPDHNPFQGGVAYTATVTLTANASHEFATNFANAKINGERGTVSNNTGETATVLYNFPQTPLIKVTGIEIKSQPANLAYTHGDALDLYGLAITLAYSDNTTEDISMANFASKGITTNPAYGTKLSASLNNNTRITVIYNNSPTIRTTTNPLTVSKIEIPNAEIIVTPPAKNQVPSAIATAASEIDYAIGTVIWNPSHSTFQNGTQYVATVTLTAREGYAFTAKTIATFNGETAQATLGQGGATITLTHVFPKILADFILVNIDGLLLDEPDGNKFAYVAPCGEDSASININTNGTEDAIIVIDGKNTNSQDVKLSYGNNKVSITAIAPNSAQEYELTINKPFPDDAMIKVRWNNTLTVINNGRYNNYNFESYKWYRNGMAVGSGRSWTAGSSGEKLKPEDKYHVEATTKDGETIRSCYVTLKKQAQAYGITLKRNSENSFEFEVAAPEKSEIEIAVYDIAGNLVSTPTGNTIRNIPKGLYFVVAKAKGESGEVHHYSAKLVVKK